MGERQKWILWNVKSNLKFVFFMGCEDGVCCVHAIILKAVLHDVSPRLNDLELHESC